MSSPDEPVPARIRRHSRQLVRELDVVAVSYLDTGYTLTQCHVLFELSLASSLKLQEIADRLLMDKSNMSRTVKKLVGLGLISVARGEADGRERFLSLTAAGRKVLGRIIRLADSQVRRALENLDEDQQTVVIQGLQLYATALRKSRLQAAYAVRRIRKRDNEAVAELIRSVLTEFNAVGEGYSITDHEVDDMFGNYRDRSSCYFLVVRDEEIVGSGGIAPLEGGDATTCELRKMFLRPAVRGLGLGRRLLTVLLDEARKRGYRRCYLETLDRMHRANELYRRAGFEPLKAPLGSTGHCSCDRWYALDLQSPPEHLPARSASE